MSKRKLNKRQQRRVRQKQESHLKQDADSPTLNTMDGEQGIVIANYGKTALIEDLQKNQFTCHIRQNLDTLVCGDHVVFKSENNDSGIVLAIEPRQNYLARPDRKGQAKVVAANIDQIMIVAACKPALNTRLIDRYIVAAELSELTPIIIFNKTDLTHALNSNNIREQLSIYQELGYKLVFTSVKQLQGIDTLEAILADKTSVFVGQSGVGKSSLINTILPEAKAEVGDISDNTQKGRHTTTLTRLYHLPHGGHLIDSPGIREFGLWQVQLSETAEGFIEFRPFLGQCRFRDCLHEDEPGCRIRAAVEEDRINRQRWESYRRIIESLRDGI